jgi:hypothetical protein
MNYLDITVNYVPSDRSPSQMRLGDLVEQIHQYDFIESNVLSLQHVSAFVKLVNERHHTDYTFSAFYRDDMFTISIS